MPQSVDLVISDDGELHALPLLVVPLKLANLLSARQLLSSPEAVDLVICDDGEIHALPLLVVPLKLANLRSGKLSSPVLQMVLVDPCLF